jgi:hypothetical protein
MSPAVSIGRKREGGEPTVAVVIPTYNRADMLIDTLDSILYQTRAADEIIVMDDGSTDGTASAVNRLGGAVDYMRQDNSGKPAALNNALRHVNCDYVWLMDDDDLAMPNAIQSHLEFLAGHPDIDFTYSGHYKFRGERPPRDPKALIQDTWPAQGVRPEELFVHSMFGFPFYLQGMLIPNRCLREVGPFDERLTFTEDYDMILRLARKFRGGRLECPTFYFRIHSGTRGPAHRRSLARDRRRNFREFEKIVFTKVYDSVDLEGYLPGRRERGALNREDSRLAHLQRACIMARHGLFDRGLDDLSYVLDDSANRAGEAEPERRILSQLLTVEAWWLREYPNFTTRLGQVLRARNANKALHACAAGLAWRFQNCLKRRQLKDAALIALHLKRLAGPDFPRLFNAAIRRRFERQPAS